MGDFPSTAEVVDVARVLIVTWDGGGNVPPAVLLADELRGRGDTVRFLGQARQRDYFESKGFDFEAVRGSESWNPTVEVSDVVGMAQFARLITDRRFGADTLRSIRRRPVDVVIIDVLLFGALRAAHRAQLTHVVLVHTVFDFVVDATDQRSPLQIVARLSGLRPRRYIRSADLVLVASVSELEQRTRSGAPATVQHTGALLPSSAGEIAVPLSDDPPLVVVSFSTTYLRGQDAAYQRVMNALADLPVQVVVTTGPAVKIASLDPPPNAIVRPYIPHALLLPRASVLVGHGGHATTVQALASDVPIVFLPQNPIADQELIATRVEQLGAGIALDSAAPIPHIAAAVTEMLAPGPHRDSAARLGAAIREAGGAARAADLVESLAVR
jgi:UDP:flavonoid glycosyltransferase YjiC (YdhE family)